MDISAFVIACLIAAVGGGIGILLGRMGREAQRLASERERAEVLTALARSEQEASTLREDRDAQKAIVVQLDKELGESVAAVARLEERERGLNRQLTDQAAELTRLQEKLTTEFENISNRVLLQVSGQVSAGSEKRLEALLTPFRERLGDFQKRVEETYDKETRDVLSLKAQISSIAKLNETLGAQADSLARALKGDVKAAGRWGELVLERILEDSGLVDGREFVRQGQGLGLKSEHGGAQRPDILVRLPEHRYVIIDSKMPLTHYEAFFAAEDPKVRTECVSQFVCALRNHIGALAGKRYQDADNIIAHDYVLLFLPIEGALALALQQDSTLFSYAWEKQVILVGPSTLMMTLKTVGSIWRYQRQSENAEKIAKAGAALYDKLVGFVDELSSVGERLDQAQRSYSTAMDRLKTGRGNLLARAEGMRKLGLQPKKLLPSANTDVDVAEEDHSSNAIGCSAMPSEYPA